ncbi:uncharacterized protein LOC129600063 isoform X2 [Paramacrobiotus metropolitanus]|uniref:uncharacterized protein LOC129600063 isoform X2 n=1 Tax=Paramacrobiotus metropolitanus TaxID=2943436 RepID=UPI002445E499|nr:uncharacterized protein LOC129600063 isoform X2 [Paramacrobiotus metropolitanus]
MIQVLLLLFAFTLIYAKASTIYNPDNLDAPIYPPSPELAYGQYSAQPCGFPNTMPSSTYLHEPNKTYGLWYSYRRIAPAGTHTINGRFFVHSITRTVVPLTETSAEYMWFGFSNYHSPTGDCHYGYWVGSFGTDGTQLGDLYLSDTGYAPMNVVEVLSDYTSIAIAYGCARPSRKTGLCEQPIVLVSTRTRPSRLSYNERLNIDRAVNSVFTPYCISAEDIPLQTFVDSKPDCDFPDPPEEIAKKIRSLALLRRIKGKPTLK